MALALVAAFLTAWLSLYLGRVWAERDLVQRVALIRNNLQSSTFPLTTNVLDSISSLTGAQLVVFREGSVAEGTLGLTERQARALQDSLEDLPDEVAEEARGLQLWSLDDRSYYRFDVERLQQDERILLLMDRSQVDQSAKSAALFPLVAGLSTVTLLILGTLGIVGSIIRRLRKVASRVAQAAAGDFKSRVADPRQDEIGQLARSVDRMAVQLDELWGEVNQTQSQKLLYQVASGLAHQLRNTMTGAKMALELHRRALEKEGQQTTEEVLVALEQLKVAEDHLRRLLVVGQGKQGQDEPALVETCLEAIRSATLPLAKHLKCNLTFEAETIAGFQVRDGHSFTAAVTNLVQNSVQEAEEVSVQVSLANPTNNPCELRVEVCDNGPGIAKEIQDRLYEPFVTTKPEGMGLGLPVAKQAAEYLGGKIEWERGAGQTTFRLLVQCQPIELINEPERSEA